MKKLGVSQEDLQTARLSLCLRQGACVVSNTRTRENRGVGQNSILLLRIRAPIWEGGDLDFLDSVVFILHECYLCMPQFQRVVLLDACYSYANTH